MYRAFYGLREKPFNLTPDPRFLYLSDKHKEAFAHLLYGIRSRSGFVMVTGEIGTGKTTICRNLLNQLDEDTELAFIFNPMLNPLELLKKIVSEFGVDSTGVNTLELTEALNQYLLEAAAKGKNCVLLIDEAQNLDPQVLEQIRLLSNLETETEKLLQIVLVGQPELGEKLELHELRQLNQRIAARYHLRPLSEKEVLQYIAYRLHVAGGRRKVKFARTGVRAIYKISGGTPRVINALCDRALLIGFTKEVHTLTASIVHRAHREIRGDEVFGKRGSKRSLGQLLFNPITGIAAVLLVVIAFANSPVLRQRTQGLLDNLAARLPDATPVNVAPPVETPPTNTDTPRAAVPAVTLSPKTEASPKPNHPTPVVTLVAPKTPELLPADLFQGSAEDATTSALEAVLAAWDKAPGGDAPTSLDAETLETYAKDRGLAIEFLRPAIDQLVALDLPAIVHLQDDDQIRAVALTSATNDTLTLTSGTTTWPMDRSAFHAHYTGEAIVLWDDPTPQAATMLPGSRSTNVRNLRTVLARLGRIPATGNSDTYDGAVSKAVARIQAETSLDVDGIAGKQVRMVLQSWTKGTGTPYLSKRLDMAHDSAKVDDVVAAAPTPDVKPGQSSTTDVEPTETTTSPPVIVADETSTPPKETINTESAHPAPVLLSNIGKPKAEQQREEEAGEEDVSPSDFADAATPESTPGSQLTVVELAAPGSSPNPPPSDDASDKELTG